MREPIAGVGSGWRSLFVLAAREGGGVDIDLPLLHGNMLYAAVYHMVNGPSACAGNRLIRRHAVMSTVTLRPIHAPSATRAGCASGRFRLSPPQPQEGSHILLVAPSPSTMQNRRPVPMLTDAAFASELQQGRGNLWNFTHLAYLGEGKL